MPTKNKLLKFLHAKGVLYDKTLHSTLIYPYTAFQEVNKKPLSGADSAIWCAEQAKTLGSTAMELEDDVAFGELVSSLRLNGALLAV